MVTFVPEPLTPATEADEKAFKGSKMSNRPSAKCLRPRHAIYINHVHLSPQAALDTEDNTPIIIRVAKAWGVLSILLFSTHCQPLSPVTMRPTFTALR
jgi:hypothetical protein